MSWFWEIFFTSIVKWLGKSGQWTIITTEATNSLVSLKECKVNWEAVATRVGNETFRLIYKLLECTSLTSEHTRNCLNAPNIIDLICHCTSFYQCSNCRGLKVNLKAPSMNPNSNPGFSKYINERNMHDYHVWPIRPPQNLFTNSSSNAEADLLLPVAWNDQLSKLRIRIFWSSSIWCKLFQESISYIHSVNC